MSVILNPPITDNPTNDGRDIQISADELAIINWISEREDTAAIMSILEEIGCGELLSEARVLAAFEHRVRNRASWCGIL